MSAIIVRTPTPTETEECGRWPVWQHDPASFPWHYDEPETCQIVAGRVTVATDDGNVTFGAGDLVIFPAGLDCTWTIHEAVRKHYSFG